MRDGFDGSRIFDLWWSEQRLFRENRVLVDKKRDGAALQDSVRGRENFDGQPVGAAIDMMQHVFRKPCGSPTGAPVQEIEKAITGSQGRRNLNRHGQDIPDIEERLIGGRLRMEN